jgi:putative ABC transport system permease protein
VVVAAIHIAALWVPVRLRDRWLEEWKGELWHELSRARGGSHRRRRIALLGRAMGALRDARSARRIDPAAPRIDREPETTGDRPARTGKSLEFAERCRSSGEGGPVDPQRARRGGLGVDALARDLRLAVRSLRQRPGFTAVAVMVFAVGIGANTTVFSIVDAVLLRPLALPNSENLVQIESRSASGGTSSRVTERVYRAWQESSRAVLAFAAANHSLDTDFYLAGGDEPERIRGARVSSGFFALLGAEAARGRVFAPGDDPVALGRAVILGHGVWTRRFGADPSIVGRTIRLNDEPYEVLGVMPSSFKIDDEAAHLLGGRVAELWVPLDTTVFNDLRTMQMGEPNFDAVFARLDPRYGVARAEAELDAIYARTVAPEQEGEERRAGEVEEPRRTIHLVSLHEAMVEDARPSLRILAGIVGFVLLLVCVNVAGLHLARSGERRREVAVRAALGAGRVPLLRQFLTEGLVLSSVGGALGLLASIWAIDLLAALAPHSVPRLDEVRVDGHAFAFALALAAATGLLSAWPPARTVLRADVAGWLERSRGASPGRGARKLRDALVIVQIALAMVLLAGGGLLLRSFWHLSRVDPGMNVRNVLALDLELPAHVYGGGTRGSSDQEATAAFLAGVVESVGSVAGVQDVAIATSPPFREARDYYTDWRVRYVSERYFPLLEIPIVLGRNFERRDTRGGERVAIINQTLARQAFGDASPLGSKLGEDRPDNPAPVVIGVVADVRHERIDRAPLAAEYRALSQRPDRRVTVLARTAGEPLASAAMVRRAVWSVDPGQPIANLSTLEGYLAASESVSARRFNLQVLGAFGAVGLALAVMGIYGVIAQFVVQRRREIGVRVALGAQSADVLRLVLRQGAWLSMLGALLGFAGALAVTRVLQSLLYEVGSADMLTFIAVAALLVAVSMAATYLPARRALRVDPIVALQVE